MAQRPVWRGQLRLALVSCPVALYAANHERGSLHFNLLNPKTGNRIRMVSLDAETGAELKRTDLVKGYEYRKGSYLTLTDEDFDSARVESSAVIKIAKFVDAAAIDPIYYDASYYLAPDGDAGLDVYVVLRDAIAASRKGALSRVVIARRERAIAIMPMDKGLVAHTLHEDRDLNDAAELFRGLPTAKPEAEMIALATQLIERQTGKYDAADVEDHYEARLRELIAAKLDGKDIEPEEDTAPERGNVVDLMAALKRSLAGGKMANPVPKRPKKPAKPAKPVKRRRA